MIKLRQEFDNLLEDKELYFSGSSDRGEKYLVIKGNCGNILYTFSDIIFTKPTKKDLEFIRSLIEPRMIEINKLLGEIKIKQEELNKLRYIFYKSDKDKGTIRTWNNSIHLHDDSIYFNDDYSFDYYNIEFKTINEVQNKMKFFDKKLKEWKDVAKLEKELNSLKTELYNGCSI